MKRMKVFIIMWNVTMYKANQKECWELFEHLGSKRYRELHKTYEISREDLHCLKKRKYFWKELIACWKLNTRVKRKLQKNDFAFLTWLLSSNHTVSKFNSIFCYETVVSLKNMQYWILPLLLGTLQNVSAHLSMKCLWSLKFVTKADSSYKNGVDSSRIKVPEKSWSSIFTLVLKIK